MFYLLSNYRSLLFLLALALATNTLQAQVPVHEEPRHRPVFQNAEVRILNVLLPPGDTTQYHLHNTPSVFIFFTSTNTGSQLQGNTASFATSTAGRILFENLASPNIRVHRVWNTDKDTFHVMDIELLFKDPVFKQEPLSTPELTLEIDTAWTRAYRVSLPKGKTLQLSDRVQPFILVSLNHADMQVEQGGKSQRQKVAPGSFFDIRREESFSIENITSDTVAFWLLEIPK